MSSDQAKHRILELEYALDDAIKVAENGWSRIQGHPDGYDAAWFALDELKEVLRHESSESCP